MKKKSNISERVRKKIIKKNVKNKYNEEKQINKNKIEIKFKNENEV